MPYPCAKSHFERCQLARKASSPRTTASRCFSRLSRARSEWAAPRAFACPEDVIDVSGSVPIGDGTVPEREAIVEKAVVECSICGEPFASEAGLDAMREQLDEAALDGLDLEVCPACRSEQSVEREFMAADRR